MLQQILSDMFIDPDLLAELDDEQKQTLFCKMREEQVRRWTLWEKEMEREQNRQTAKQAATKANKRHVQFLLGADSEPWTWVMGDHPSDKSIDDILEKEAREEARKLVEQEEQLAQVVVKPEPVVLIQVPPRIKPPLPVKPVFPLKVNPNQSMPFSVRNVRAEILSNGSSEDNGDNETWIRHKEHQNHHKEQRESEIYESIRETQRKADELSELVRKEQEELWQARERKAKDAERQIREIARHAREEHKKVNRTSSQDSMNGGSVTSTLTVELAEPETKFGLKHKRSAAFTINNRNKSRPNKPPSRDAIVEWFCKEELPQGSGLDPVHHQEVPWFHGVIGRAEAETSLLPCPEGSFLVRLSERIWGYAISYRSKERCKHFLIDASAQGQYQFFGSGHLTHTSLYDLVTYHKNRPITSTGHEYLLLPCPRSAAVITSLKDLLHPPA